MTMKPSLFWAEPAEISALLRRVRSTASAPVAVPSFTSSAASSPAPASAAPSAPAHIPLKVSAPTHIPLKIPTVAAESSTAPPSSTATPATPSPVSMATASDARYMPGFEVPEGPLEDRLAALLDWVRSFVDFDHAFVVDQEGLALVHEAAPLELIAAAAAMSETWESLRNRFALADDSHLAVALLEAQHLQLLTTTTEWGRLSLGLVLQSPIPRSRMEAIGEKFQRTLATKEPSGP